MTPSFGKLQESSDTELAMTFAEISRELSAATSVLDTLKRIVDLSVTVLNGCDGAGISFVSGEAVVTPVWTHPRVLEIDTLQYETGEGPCLDAITHSNTFYAEDLSTDTRWPAFGPRAAAMGMRSLLSFTLRGTRTLGALNLYGHYPSAYDTLDRSRGLVFTTHAGLVLEAAAELGDVRSGLERQTKRLSSMQQALRSREVISLAQGILMQREGIGADEAYTLMRRASLHLNAKLQAVAQAVVDNGWIPSRIS